MSEQQTDLIIPPCRERSPFHWQCLFKPINEFIADWSSKHPAANTRCNDYKESKPDFYTEEWVKSLNTSNWVRTAEIVTDSYQRAKLRHKLNRKFWRPFESVKYGTYKSQPSKIVFKPKIPKGAVTQEGDPITCEITFWYQTPSGREPNLVAQANNTWLEQLHIVNDRKRRRKQANPFSLTFQPTDCNNVERVVGEWNASS